MGDALDDYWDLEEIMSLHSPNLCNFCTLSDIAARAAQAGKFTTTRISGAWVEVHVHDLDQELTSPETRDGTWRASFMELPGKCAC